jgi:hypothetical protein
VCSAAATLGALLGYDKSRQTQSRRPAEKLTAHCLDDSSCEPRQPRGNCRHLPQQWLPSTLPWIGITAMAGDAQMS